MNEESITVAEPERESLPPWVIDLNAKLSSSHGSAEWHAAQEWIGKGETTMLDGIWDRSVREWQKIIEAERELSMLEVSGNLRVDLIGLTSIVEQIDNGAPYSWHLRAQHNAEELLPGVLEDMRSGFFQKGSYGLTLNVAGHTHHYYKVLIPKIIAFLDRVALTSKMSP